MPNKVETLHGAIRHHAALKSLVALESTLSYPIPYANRGQVYLRFFVFDKGRAQANSGQVPVHRPHARVSAEYETGKLVEYVDLRFEEGQPVAQARDVIGFYPHEAMANLSFEMAKAARTSLFYHTQQVIPLLGRTALSTEEMRIVHVYRETFEQVVEPCLRPHYEALSPAFFAWLKDARQ